jgi:hypothetical protein
MTSLDIDLNGDGFVSPAEIALFTQALTSDGGHSWGQDGTSASAGLMSPEDSALHGVIWVAPPPLRSTPPPPPFVSSVAFHQSLCQCCNICDPSPPPPPPIQDQPPPPPSPLPPAADDHSWWPSYCYHVPVENLPHWVGCNRHPPPSPPLTPPLPPGQSPPPSSPSQPPYVPTPMPPPSPSPPSTFEKARAFAVENRESVALLVGVGGGGGALLIAAVAGMALYWRRTRFVGGAQILPKHTHPTQAAKGLTSVCSRMRVPHPNSDEKDGAAPDEPTTEVCLPSGVIASCSPIGH